MEMEGIRGGNEIKCNLATEVPGVSLLGEKVCKRGVKLANREFKCRLCLKQVSRKLTGSQSEGWRKRSTVVGRGK